MADILSLRALNRATLARNLLLDRAEMEPLTAIEHLVGMQAQVPTDPYTALWSRLRSFDPLALGELIRGRVAVRGPLMRGTLHLVSADDMLHLRPVVQPVLDRAFASSPFIRSLDGVDLEAVAAAGRAILDERPRTRVELGAALAERWPGIDEGPLAYAITFRVPVVQVPPRGVWGERGQAVWTTAEGWIGRRLADPDVDAVVRRYLRVFGPASVMDAQAWCGLTKLAASFERLRPELRIFADDAGRELFDLPEAPRPDPDTPAPVRFLPEYDNLWLSHADRTRVIDDDFRRRFTAGETRNRGTVLVDGTVRCLWGIEREGDAACLTVEPIGRFSKADTVAMEAEGLDLLSFLSRDAGAKDVRIKRPAG